MLRAALVLARTGGELVLHPVPDDELPFTERGHTRPGG